MNGASAELSAKTISTPNSSIMTTMGKSQNFFRSRKKAHSSSNKDKFFLSLYSQNTFLTEVTAVTTQKQRALRSSADRLRTRRTAVP